MKVIVNGCFDNFHYGHQFILSFAKTIAGHLGTIHILLNTDRSVKELKGEGRPKQNLKERIKEIRSYLENMDPRNPSAQFKNHWSIHKFDTEKELSKLITNIDPDIIIKGNDRPDVREIVGSDKYPVCILPRLKDKDGNDISTTRLLNG
jgi:cytidyltransferase-like protein